MPSPRTALTWVARWLLPIELVEGRQMLNLRLSPAKNNQTLGVTWAEQYELGAIAQLGERVTGSHEVAGSSPASSIAVPVGLPPPHRI